ncbi:MAG: hypothetical protein IPP31_07510 [Chitinophagaceae bacterium]|nr:hypothetical protein [Chitinophagaceae bacterium]
MKLKTVLPFLSIILFTCPGCSSNEIGESRDVNQDKIYFDYHIYYLEGDAEAEMSFTYRFAGINGTTLVLSEPSQVELDGQRLKVDSTSMGGAFYRTYVPVQKLHGPHEIIFTDINGKKIRNQFSISPFKLITIPTSVSIRDSLQIGYESMPLGPDDHITINSENTDSSFSYWVSGPGNGPLVIPASELQRQKEGFISFDAKLVLELPLSQSTPEGGRIRIRYSLKPVKIKLVK